MIRIAAAAATALISAVFATSAAALPITLDETFTITGFSSSPPSVPPLSTVTGSFSLTFDNSADAINTSGTVLSISASGLSLAGATPQFFYDHASDTLHLGAFVGGNFVTNAGTNNIGIHISDVSTTPMFVDAQYSQTGQTLNFASRTGTLSATATSVPEPASLALLSIGFLAMGFRTSRRP